MPIFGCCVVRVADRLLLLQSLVAASASSASSSSAAPPACASSPVLWGEIVSKSSAPNFRTSAFTEVGDPVVRLGYHILTDDELGFAVVTDEATPRRVAHQALDEVSKLFRRMFVENVSKLSAATCEVFKQPLQQLLAKYSDPTAVADEKIKRVKQTVEEVKGLALDNVERVLQRGQQIDEIISATDDLQAQAQGFQRSSRALRQQMWWNDIRAKAAIGVAVAIFLLLVYVVFCGGLSCSSSSQK